MARPPQIVSLEPLVAQLTSAVGGQLPGEQMTVDFQHGPREFRLIFDSLMFRQEPAGIRIDSCDFYLLGK